MVVLFADTDSDLTPAVAKEYGCHLISMPYSIDGETVYPYEDFDVFDGKAFYNRLRTGVIPTTSAIGKERYIRYFEPVLAEGNDILYIHFSRAMSATFASMDEAIAELLARYPDRKIHTVDTNGITTITYLIVREAADRLRAGMTAEQVVEWVASEANHFAFYFFADDLQFFRHSGRVSGLAATMGTLLGVRPIIYMNEEGKMVSVGKERGRARAIDRLISTVEELGDHVTDYRVVIGHTDADEIVAEIADALRAKYGEALRLESVIVNPTAGSHCGPDGVGIAFHALHR